MRLIKINNKLKNNIGRTMAMMLILSSVAIFTSGCLGGGQDSTKVLNVYNVGDYIDESLISESLKSRQVLMSSIQPTIPMR